MGRWFRWLFFLERDQKEQCHEFLRGFLLLVAGLLANSVVEILGGYERLEWGDLDRNQNAARPTEARDLALLLIDNDDFITHFGGVSPLKKEKLAELIISVCRVQPRPRAVLVDIATDSWPPEYYAEAVKPRLDHCHVVWVWEGIAAKENSDGSQPSSHVVLGKVLGRSEPPDGVCTAVPEFPRDGDGVIRHYRPWVLASQESQIPPAPRPFWTVVSALIDDKTRRFCGEILDDLSETEPREEWIRYTADPRLQSMSVKHFLAAVEQKTVDTFFKDRIVILGVENKYARDEYATPLGARGGARVIANAIYTARGAPIKPVSHWISFVVHVCIGVSLLAFLIWSKLRWFWATIISLALTWLAALFFAWKLFDYNGHFVGVLGGLAGVVLVELINVLLDPFKEMWATWMNERPGSDSHKAAGATSQNAADRGVT